MKKILAFAGSTNPQSINQKLVQYATGLLTDEEAEVIDLRDFPLPIYSIDSEQEKGVPKNAVLLREIIANHDALIISLAEHNGSITTVLKNALDWMSRAGKDYRFLKDKPILLLSTSPSPYGGRAAIIHAEQILKVLGGNVLSKYSIPSFYSNMTVTESGIEIRDEEIKEAIKEHVNLLRDELSVLA